MRYLASIQYDGSLFYGFQRLNDFRSVQKELELVLTKINKDEVLVKGAGRTDRGVHARCQMCHFDITKNIDENGLRLAMNSMLPSDIYVNYLSVVSDDFHARHNVKEKVYTYVINMGKYDAIKDKYLYNFGRKLDIKLMKRACKVLKGAHSYKAFVSGSRDNYNSIIYDIKIKRKQDLLYISFIGTSFYRYMVRNLVGALVMVGINKMSIVELENMLNSGERNNNYMTVPANGLYLDDIKYQVMVMKKGFSLVEIIISLSLISVVFLFAIVIIKKSDITYADPYESLRKDLSLATELYFNTSGISKKDELYQNGEVIINSNVLIENGFLDENYYVENTKESKNLQNIDIIVSLDEEGFMNFEINL